MSEINKEARELFHEGFDLGLISESEQLRTTLQMRQIAVDNHKKHLAEIDSWIKNQKNGLKRRIAQVKGVKA